MPRVVADVRFEVDTPDGRPVRGSVRSDGGTIFLACDDLAAFAAGRDGGDLRMIARRLAGEGVTVQLVGDDGPVMQLGVVRRRTLHRLVTRSPHVHIDDWRAAAALRARVAASSGDTLAPPPQFATPLLPPLPGRRRRVTTTHDPHGGGHPRLYLTDTRLPQMARRVQWFRLAPGLTRIGSGDDVDLQLAGTDALQALVERTPEDEYVLLTQGRDVRSYVNGRELPEQLLRTGSRIEMGPWRLTYVRDEHADHGRPYGGRVGGELGYQRPQDTPVYQR